MNEKGEKQTGRIEGYDARCYLHELDHLLGITYKDRASKLKWDMATKKAKKRGYKVYVEPDPIQKKYLNKLASDAQHEYVTVEHFDHALNEESQSLDDFGADREKWAKNLHSRKIKRHCY